VEQLEAAVRLLVKEVAMAVLLAALMEEAAALMVLMVLMAAEEAEAAEAGVDVSAATGEAASPCAAAIAAASADSFGRVPLPLATRASEGGNGVLAVSTSDCPL
jgi:hypothetical protein